MKVQIKPRILKAKDKNELISQINRLAGHSGRCFPLMTKDNDQYVLYNLQKHNKKTIINKRKKKLSTEKGVSFQRDIVRRREWMAYVYFVPKSLVKKCNQKNRNFTIEFK